VTKIQWTNGCCVTNNTSIPWSVECSYLILLNQVANVLFTVIDQSLHQLDAGTGKKIEQFSILCRFPALAFLDIFWHRLPHYTCRFTSAGWPAHVTWALLIGSRPSYHYFRSVCLFVCLSVCLSVCLCRVFLSRLWSDFDQTRTHFICLGLVVSPRI